MGRKHRREPERNADRPAFFTYRDVENFRGEDFALGQRTTREVTIGKRLQIGNCKLTNERLTGGPQRAFDSQFAFRN